MDQLARGKRSVAVNLKSPEGVETVLRLDRARRRAARALSPRRDGAPRARSRCRLRAQSRAWSTPASPASGRTARTPPWPGTTSTTSPSRARCRCSAARARSRWRPSTCSATSPAAACCARSASAWRCSSARTRARARWSTRRWSTAPPTSRTFVYKFRNAGMWRDERGTNMLDSGAPFYDTYRTKDGRVHVGRRDRAAVLRRAAQGPRARCGGDAAPAGPVVVDGDRGTLRRGLRDARRATSGARSSTAPTPASRRCSLWARRTSIPHNRARGLLIADAQGKLEPAPAPRLSRTPGDGSAAAAGRRGAHAGGPGGVRIHRQRDRAVAGRRRSRLSGRRRDGAQPVFLGVPRGSVSHLSLAARARAALPQRGARLLGALALPRRARRVARLGDLQLGPGYAARAASIRGSSRCGR